MRLQEIKERLAKVKENNKTNIVQKEHEDIEWLINRIEKYVSVNIKLTQDYVDAEDRIERLKCVLEKLRNHGNDEEVVNLHYSKLYVRRVADDALKEME